ncbi:hypothetical protein ACLBYG_21945 [Methylobacterium sp. D53M]
MRVSFACLVTIFAVAAWMIPPVEPTEARGWGCTRQDTLSFAGIPALTWNRCTQWTRKGER